MNKLKVTKKNTNKNVPKNKKLYEQVKKLADDKFLAKTSIYKSSWIVREYKKRGGTYIGNKKKIIGLKRWYLEKWVDLTRPLKNGKGFKQCGRTKATVEGTYPFCRPTVRINKKTPRTWKEMSDKSITKLVKQKQEIKNTGMVSTRGNGNTSKQ